MATLMAEPSIKIDGRLETAIERITRLLAGEKPGAPLTLLEEDVRLIRTERSADTYWYPRIGYALRLIHEFCDARDVALDWATKLVREERIEGFTLDAMREKFKVLREHLEAREFWYHRVDEAELKFRLVESAVEVIEKVLDQRIHGLTPDVIYEAANLVEATYEPDEFVGPRLQFARSMAARIQRAEAAEALRAENERLEAARLAAEEKERVAKREKREQREKRLRDRAIAQRDAAKGPGGGKKEGKKGGGKKGR